MLLGMELLIVIKEIGKTVGQPHSNIVNFGVELILVRVQQHRMLFHSLVPFHMTQTLGVKIHLIMLLMEVCIEKLMIYIIRLILKVI